MSYLGKSCFFTILDIRIYMARAYFNFVAEISLQTKVNVLSAVKTIVATCFSRIFSHL